MKKLTHYPKMTARTPLPEDDGKDPAAKAMGAKGGKARAAKLTPEQRSDIAKKAAAKRWSDRKE